MAATPSPDVTRDRGWQAALAVTLFAVVFAFAGVLADLVKLWTTRADYSHGLLVVPFVGYLLWTRRDLFPPVVLRWPDPWGLPFFAGGAAMLLAADRFNIAKESIQGVGLLACLAGVVVMFCGRWRGLAWAWPGLVMLLLTLPLPYSVEQNVSLKLRSIATEGSNFAFQTLGLPSYTEGNVIVAGDTRLEVAEACSGLSMLLVFVALTAAIVFLYRSRPVVDRAIILASSVPIAVLCNLIRIVATGLVYHAGWKGLGDALIHDLFGWAMMPLALLFIWLELRLMDWLVPPEEQVSKEDALKLLTVPRPGAVAGPTR